MVPPRTLRAGRAILLALMAGAVAPALRADSVQLVAVRDNTLYESSTGALSNGVGSYFFVGNTNQLDGENTRRALLRFDVAGAVPAGSTISAATLVLTLTKTGDTQARSVDLHRVTADWGEGTSNDNAQEGNGAPATAGDATWLHRFYDTTLWAVPGGDFASTASASSSVGVVLQAYSWSSAGMGDDVQAWLDVPASNFGWLVAGDESTARTARRFSTREDNTAANRPRLTVTYTPPPSTGGCCQAGGICTVLTPLDCASLGGGFQGLGTSCSPNPCQQPVGACCLGDGSCQEVSATQCAAAGGLYHGNGTTCAAVSCAQPSGACCVPGNPGSCQALSSAQCAAASGSFLGNGTQCGVDLCPFVDPLPLPAVAVPTTGTPGGAASYTLAITETDQQLHRDLPPTRVWAYGGSYPGPTIEASTGQPVEVTWLNDLRDENGELRAHHLLPVELCLHGPDMEGDTARVVTHLHGGHVPAAVDGYPEATLLPGEQAVYAYPNNQPPATLWYHDHALGITRLNVYLGLAGLYLVRDAYEAALGLPAGEHEVPLVLQDRSFAGDGSFLYPAAWDEHFFGDKILVNGKVWPYLEVERGKYRFRILDGANSRTFRLRLSNGAAFQQIGTDGGLLPAPVALSELVLTPGERADVVIDFAGYANGTVLRLVNDAPAPFPGTPGVGVVEDVLEFRVKGAIGHTDPLPAVLRPVEPLPPAEAVATRSFELQKFNDACGGVKWLINGLGWDSIVERPLLGTSEIWRFVNRSGVVHPMHMHLVMFQILDRQPFTVVDGQIVPVGSPVPPPANEAGWKDTVAAYPSEIVRVIAQFTDYAGKYPYHCHVLEHEDHEMMRQFETCAASAPAISAPAFAAVGATGLEASVPAQAGAAFVWTLADRDGADLSALIQSGQGGPAIVFDAAPAGTTMLLGVGGTTASGCPIPAASRAVQVDFLDVAPDSPFHDAVIALAANGVTRGCGAGRYCPGNAVTREQAALLLLRAKDGAGAPPAACGGDPFNDVPASDPFCRWIRELTTRGIAAGCDVGRFCPDDPLRRDAMARLVVKTLDPTADPPPCSAPPFTDVPAGEPACRWIQTLADLEATDGCDVNRYCPLGALTREQAALVWVKAFGLAFP